MGPAVTATIGHGPQAPERPDRSWTTVLFFTLAITGIVVATVLGIHAVRDRPDLEVSDARVQRDGLVAAVQVTVHNRGGDALCPVIQIAARNRDGLDIDKLQGQPVDGTGRVDPGATAGFRAVFDHLDSDDYERLDKFVGYVDRQSRC
jgi:hypothetical protein